eukprot:15449254-Alexandrium_andersonii.AAC.1
MHFRGHHVHSPSLGPMGQLVAGPGTAPGIREPPGSSRDPMGGSKCARWPGRSEHRGHRVR